MTKTNTAKLIIELLKQNQQMSAHQLSLELGISRQGMFKQLKKLLEQNSIEKVGSAPKVFYSVKTVESVNKKSPNLYPPQIADCLEKNYLIITPAGKILKGISGFEYWCEKRKLKPTQQAEIYFNTIEKVAQFKTGPAKTIDGTDKLKSTFGNQTALDKLYYIDFYSIEIFGKTHLGTMLLYAKQSQDRSLIKEVFKEIESTLQKIIVELKIDAVGFIPHTVKREVQLMNEIKRMFVHSAHLINLQKIKNAVPVPQKTLSKLEDRIENADSTIIVNSQQTHKNILLLDDAVGSGSTLNQTARKIRQQNLCTGKIYGLAITGSYKGFDVINEV